MLERDPQKVLDALTHKQRRFCEEYVKDFLGTRAIIDAGYQTKYPNRMANTMLRNPAIRLCIDAIKLEQNKYSDVSKDYVLEKLIKTVESAEKDKNHNATLRGLELLARHLGMFIERQEISGPDGEAIKIEKTKEDAAEVTRSIISLADRARKA